MEGVPGIFGEQCLVSPEFQEGGAWVQTYILVHRDQCMQRWSEGKPWSGTATSSGLGEGQQAGSRAWH